MVPIRFESCQPGLLRALSRHVSPSLYYSWIRPEYSTDWQRAFVLEINEVDWQVPVNAARLPQARIALDLLRQYQVSIFNDSLAPLPDWLSDVPAGGWVLLVDQCQRQPGASQANAFARLVEDALARHPAHQLVVKRPPRPNPDTVGMLEGLLGDHPDIQWIDEECDAWEVLPWVSTLYTVDSHLGFEALVVGGRTVHVYGQPWYGGWGLTVDESIFLVPRLYERSLEELFAMAYLVLQQYYNPHTQQPATLIEVLDILWHQKRVNRRNAGRVFCLNAGHFRGRRIEPFLQSTHHELHFVKTLDEARALGLDRDSPQNSQVYVWGFTKIAGLEEARAVGEFRFGRIEDGFIRSVGLGSDLIRPDSLAVDTQGIYYDPQEPSELERILQETVFDAHLIERAKRLRQRILEHDLSKYNIEYSKSLAFDIPTDRRVLLVASQIEDDASVLRGCPGIADNLTLLETVRRNNPEAFIIYKIHPDVVAGNREGQLPRSLLLEYANVVSHHDNIARLIQRSDEVHTMTSLAGFEALLREKTVFTYGLPFYAGWGLTRDAHHLPRRQRTLSLDELVAGTLILYPTYVDAATCLIDTPENVVTRQIRFLNTRLPWPVRVLTLLLGRVLFQVSRIARRSYRQTRRAVRASATSAPVSGVE